uniref:MHC class II beta chain N-terminal domain-containing protein n=1 Tax=Fundulus heteroclitus TaxID=8078 RepID=A0A3Q2QWG4_FUNHE
PHVSVFCLSCTDVLVLFCSSDGFENYAVDRCVFNSSELNDIEFIRSNFYNKLELFRFSSSVGKFVGYTEYGVQQADYRNSQASILQQMKAQREAYCLNNIDINYQAVLTKSGECLC